MPKVMLIAGMADHVPCHEGYDLIGVDYGAVVCRRYNEAMICAIGDFDSIDSTQLHQLEADCSVIRLPEHKNETDSEAAILYALSIGYDEIILYGALGGRKDHEMANMYLLMYRDYPLQIMDERNRIRCIKEGIYHIQKEYTYLSFLPLEPSVITEKGVSYPLDHRTLTVRDVYGISNEIVDHEAVVEVHQGRLLMIESND